MHVSIMGDSISTYHGLIPSGYEAFYTPDVCKRNGLERAHDTWWAQVLDALGATLLVNDSYSGSQVTGEDFPCACGWERVRALTTQDASPDLVLVFIGVNDFGFDVPCDKHCIGLYADDAGDEHCHGIAHASGVEKSRVVTHGSSTSGGLPNEATPFGNTFDRAYRLMLRRIKRTCPGANIVCATIPTPRMVDNPSWSFDEKWRDRTPLARYNERIRDAAAAEGAMVADLAAADECYATLDGLHPNKQGHTYLAQRWIHELKHLGVALR